MRTDTSPAIDAVNKLQYDIYMKSRLVNSVNKFTKCLLDNSTGMWYNNKGERNKEFFTRIESRTR